jgi:hypothetical protein
MVSSSWVGLRFRGVEGESSRGAEDQESIGHRGRETRSRLERTRRRNKASKRVKLVERAGSTARDPRRPGSELRLAERESIAGGRIQATVLRHGSWRNRW